MSFTCSLEKLSVNGGLLFDILENLGSAIIVLNLEKKILYLNKVASKITGHTKEELLGKKILSSLFALLDEEKCSLEMLMNSSICEFDALLKRKDQKDFYAHLVISLITLEEGEKLIIINFFDITEKKELEKKLFEASITDYLTGLYNRRFITEALQKEKELSDRYNIPFSLVLLDIDYFKFINDLYGHEVGDKVLIEIAKVLKKKIRASDLSARWGGEEFLVLLRNTYVEQARIVAEKLREEISALRIPPAEWVSASFGVSAYRRGESIDDTLRRADIALLQAKAKGKNCVIVFEE